ncbi:hypothetical protein Tco_1499245 [Tanacetum coccineum]
MLNKENYVPWSSRLLRYAKSKPNGKLIYNFTMHDPYARRMIPEPGDPDREVLVAETFHEQTNDELTDKEVKQMEANDQAIQIILMGLPKDIYVAVDSCETAQEIWFTSTDGESIESYYHRFSKLMNDFKRNKHFPEKIASNLKSHNSNEHDTCTNGQGIQTNYSTPTNYNQRISSNPPNRQIAQPGINLSQDKKMLLIRGNGGNQFRQYVSHPKTSEYNGNRRRVTS